MNFKLHNLAFCFTIGCLLQLFPIVVQASNVVQERLLIEVLEELSLKYQVFFTYDAQLLKNITIDFEYSDNVNFDNIINNVLASTGLKYERLSEKYYVLYQDNLIGRRTKGKMKKKLLKIKKLEQKGIISIQRNGKQSRREMKKVLESALEMKEGITIRGKITDIDGEKLIGATIWLKGTEKGAVTDENGNYSLVVSPKEANVLVVSYTGYTTTELEIQDLTTLDIVLSPGVNLEKVTVVGSRGRPRTSFDSPVPIDNISMDLLANSGKGELDQQLMFKVPSFNSTQQPISDAAAHFSPAGLRGLLPSRTLVLVNGKRKNTSALVYSYVTAGRGEVGVDMKTISSASLERVEILRDGASAQYGSDAVAGVINLILKKKTDPFINVGYNLTSQGDGAQFQIESGFSLDLWKKGFVNFSINYLDQKRSQRAGKVSSAQAEAIYWGNSIYSLEDFDAYLERNPSAGAQVGLPDMTMGNFSFNSGFTLDKKTNTKAYAFGTVMNRKGSSPQFPRVPYWVTGFETIYPGQDYFLPEMTPKIQDYTFCLGLETTFHEWKFDLSSTIGRNRIDYFITNSFNQSMGVLSPTDFYNGAHDFSHLVNNLDVVKNLEFDRINALTIAFGAEHRTENFQTLAGEPASYMDATPEIEDRFGSESFGGFKPENASSNFRNNLGIYADISAELDKKILLGAALRYEKYSDFGDNISWKISSRYKLIPEKLNIRASVNNGFRAPSLHQVYYTALTTTLTEDGVVQNGILNNQNPALKALGIPELTPETSFNLGTGFTYRLNDKIGLTADAYQIIVDDRIVLSGQVGKTGDADSPIDQLLNSVNTSSLGFFLNAVKTKTQGIDLVLNFENLDFLKGKLTAGIAANFNKTEVLNIQMPEFIENNDLQDNIFSREDISRMETWRPRQKIIAMGTYSFHKLLMNLSMVYYGSVTYRHPSKPINDATYSGKTITDLSFTYTFTKSLNWSLGANNLFNVYPDSFADVYENGAPEDRNLDFVGRFKYPWQTTQFGIDGTRLFTKLNYKF